MAQIITHRDSSGGARPASLHSEGNPAAAAPRVQQAAIKGRPPAKVDVEDLKALFDRPQPEAARVLKISLTTLKQVCRRHGLHRWPYRRACKPSRARNPAAQAAILPALTPDLAPLAGPLQGSACTDTVPKRAGSPGTSSKRPLHDVNCHTQFLDPRGKPHWSGPDHCAGIPADSHISWYDAAIGMPARPPAPYGSWHGLNGRDAVADEEATWESSISQQIFSDVTLSTGSTALTVPTVPRHTPQPARPEFPHYPIDHHHTTSQGQHGHCDQGQKLGPWWPTGIYAGAHNTTQTAGFLANPMGLVDPFSDNNGFHPHDMRVGWAGGLSGMGGDSENIIMAAGYHNSMAPFYSFAGVQQQSQNWTSVQ